IRFNSTMQPRRARHGMKAHRGRVPVRTGNSQRGNTVEFGRYGLRLMHGTRITAKTLHACLVAVKRSLKPIKGCRIWTRMFPDVPVTSKGVGMRMGRGKGSFDHWMFRAPKGKILFEIDGPPQAHEAALAAMKLAMSRIPVRTEFVDK
ncbi:ribosomal protein L16, partial [Ramicandelaber brevisporus]